jgi:hypothetical protein
MIRVNLKIPAAVLVCPVSHPPALCCCVQLAGLFESIWTINQWIMQNNHTLPGADESPPVLQPLKLFSGPPARIWDCRVWRSNTASTSARSAFTAFLKVKPTLPRT